MVVYVDVLLSVNLYINYILLLSTSLITGFKTKSIRIFLSSLLGSIYTLIIFIDYIPDLANLLLKIIMSILMVIVAFGFINSSRFLRSVLTFFAVTFSYVGLLYLIWTVFAPTGMYMKNGVAYFNINIKILAASTVICFTVISVINYFISKKAPRNSVYTVTIEFENKFVTLKGLFDTGNSLTESFSGYPVLVAEYSAVKSIIPTSVQNYIENGETGECGNFRLIIHNTVSGTGMMPSFKPDGVTIKSLTECKRNEKIYIAVTDKIIGGGEYQVILPNKIFEEARDYAENI